MIDLKRCMFFAILLLLMPAPGFAIQLQPMPAAAAAAGHPALGHVDCNGFVAADHARINQLLLGFNNYLKNQFQGAGGPVRILPITRAMCRARQAPDAILVALLIKGLYDHDRAQTEAGAPANCYIRTAQRPTLVNDFLARRAPENRYNRFNGSPGPPARAADPQGVYRMNSEYINFMHGGVNPLAQDCYAPNGRWAGPIAAGCVAPVLARTYIGNLPYVLRAIQNGVYTLQSVIDAMPPARIISVRDRQAVGNPIRWYTLDHRRVMMVVLLAQVLGVPVQIKVAPRLINPSRSLVDVQNYLAEIEARLSARPLAVGGAPGVNNRYQGAHLSAECIELENFPAPPLGALAPLPNGVPYCQVNFGAPAPLYGACQSLFRSVVRANNSMCIR